MELIQQDHIQDKIFTIRGVQVMLDSDLAKLYQTETKFINRAVKRNPLRFPEEFMFQLSEKEWTDLKYQFGTSRNHTAVAFFATTDGEGKNPKVKLVTGSDRLKSIGQNSTLTMSSFSLLTSSIQ